MEYQIRKLSYRDEDHIEQVCRLLNSSYDQDISRYFIYRDANYQAFLSNSLQGAQDLIYIVIDLDQHELMGFAQLKVLPDTLFLNNIIIKPEYRGNNIALLLLKFMVQETVSQQNYPETFSLDVFERNTPVVQWYLRLGMNITGHKYWYNLMDYYHGFPRAISSTNQIEIVQDENGFTQVFSSEVKIGTLMNGNALVVRSMPEPDVLNQLRRHFQNSLEAFALITEQELDFPLIDKAFQMSMALKDLREI